MEHLSKTHNYSYVSLIKLKRVGWCGDTIVKIVITAAHLWRLEK